MENVYAKMVQKWVIIVIVSIVLNGTYNLLEMEMVGVDVSIIELGVNL